MANVWLIFTHVLVLSIIAKTANAEPPTKQITLCTFEKEEIYKLKRSKGEKGDKGDMGTAGLAGLPGSPGQRGAIGPPGIDGEAGTCIEGEQLLDIDDIDAEKAKEFGSKDQPANVLCKGADVYLVNGTYYIGNGDWSIKVNCYFYSTLTCIPPVKNNKIITYAKKTWLSEAGLAVEHLYGLTREQLWWLTSQSNSAYQTIRYHCKNSVPFPRDNIDNSVLLLSSNDKTIGPMPSSNKPYFYSVYEEPDHECDYSGKWGYTDIKIVSYIDGRVPAVDFYIRDVNPAFEQSVEIEHIELCFN